MDISMREDFYSFYDQQIPEITRFDVFDLPVVTEISKENRRSLCRLIYYFPQKNQDKMDWKSIEEFIKVHNNGYYYPARALLYFARGAESSQYKKEFPENERTISNEELIDLAKSLNIGRNLCERSDLKCSSEEISRTGRLRNLWTDLEREVLRKVMSDYEIKYPAFPNIKWNIVTSLFNRVIQEKDSSRPERDSRRICEQWQNFESPYVVTGKIPEKHVLPLCRLISYFPHRNNEKKMSWVALRDFIKEHNGGYYYSDNTLKLCDKNSKNQGIKNLLKEEAEISEEGAVTIAKSLQLGLQFLGNKRKGSSIEEEIRSSSLKRRVSDDGGLDAFILDPSLWSDDTMEFSCLPK